MDGKELVRNQYLEAKSNLLKDIKTWLIFGVLYAIVGGFLIYKGGLFTSGDIMSAIFLSLFLGFIFASAPIGLKTTLGFAKKILDCMSLVSIIIIVIGFVFFLTCGIAYGIIITLGKFLKGYGDIRKVGRLLK